jgi:hypothetical protein
MSAAPTTGKTRKAGSDVKCFNPKVLGGLALTGFAVFVFAPSAFSAVLPLLAVAACPLGMLVMMRGMAGGRCRTTGSGAGKERQGEAADASSPALTAEAEIARLRAEVDQLKAEKSDRERGLAP